MEYVDAIVHTLGFSPKQPASSQGARILWRAAEQTRKAHVLSVLGQQFCFPAEWLTLERVQDSKTARKV